MKQETFTDIEYSFRKKKTKREEFLEIMDEIIPWDEWVDVIAPYYPSGKRGRPPMGIEKMLRMYLLQIWFNLSDPATEDAIYDSYAMRRFTGIDFLKESVPDETTLCKFRHLLEANGLNKLFFEAINGVMVKSGHMMKGGTIVDATILNAPSSTKNADKARDPEMHQTKKGNEWRFGMKCHIGVDAGSGLVHTLTVTAANDHDITQAAALIREDDKVVYGDSGYLGIQKRPEVANNENFCLVCLTMESAALHAQPPDDGASESDEEAEELEQFSDVDYDGDEQEDDREEKTNPLNAAKTHWGEDSK